MQTPDNPAALAADLAVPVKAIHEAAQALGIPTSGRITPRNAARIAERLADEARAEADFLEAIPSPESLAAIVRDICRSFMPDAAKK